MGCVSFFFYMHAIYKPLYRKRYYVMTDDNASIEEIDMAVQLRRAYQRKWRKEHPEKAKQYAETYWRKRAREIMKGGNR